MSFSSATKYPLRGIRLVVAFILIKGFSGWIGWAVMTGVFGFVIFWGCFSSGVRIVGGVVIAGGAVFVALCLVNVRVIVIDVVMNYYYSLSFFDCSAILKLL